MIETKKNVVLNENLRDDENIITPKWGERIFRKHNEYEQRC